MPAVSIPIIDQLVRPSIGLLSRSLIAGGPFTGNGSLTPPQNPLVALTYGISWSFFTVPAAWGFILGNPGYYEPAVLELNVTHDGIDAHTYTTQHVWTGYDGDMYLWDEPLPSTLNYHIGPGVVVIFYWLQT